ncbi:MAG: glycosyl hydrolase [Cyclobacteriaceae bacterium]|nr:glycosyl hydrolase [Cyclobacteriaceae bacterium]
MNNFRLIFLTWLVLPIVVFAQKKRKVAQITERAVETELFSGLKWRNIGPFRGGRSVTSSGVVGDPMTYYMGNTGGGVWKTSDAGQTWKNISDGFFELGSVGAIGVSESDPNVIYVGMGEHAVRGVMTSHGNGVYKSTDAGKTWDHMGLVGTMTISDVIIHPTNPDIVFIAAQGAQHGSTKERGIYKSIDGGQNWVKKLFVAEDVGASSLTMDMNNPRILYVSMWQHTRYPWTMKSGGAGSGLYKSTDMGETWDHMSEGLPEEFGKSGISVSRANGNLVFAVIEADGTKGGVYRSDNAGKSWKQTSTDRVTIARSWYYMEIFADPSNENVVYVLNAPVLKSIDKGKTFQPISVPHGDNHHLWINPMNSKNMINSNDGGTNITFNGGESWTRQDQQPTAQFYRVITDNKVPYHVYGGQQDNSAIGIASRTNGRGITWKDWYSVAGCESAYLAFDPDDPKTIFGGCYQGIIDRWSRSTAVSKSIKEYPELNLGNVPKDFKYRFNWNAPIISSPHDRSVIYHAGNVVFKTLDGGINWEVISPDLTRNDKAHQGPGGGPYTNEAAGGENYNTLMYLTESPHEKGVLWAGSDDGLVHLTRDGGMNWVNVTPKDLPEAIINSIEVSPHDPATAYITVMAYKFNNLKPMVYKTTDYGVSWVKRISGIDDQTVVRVVREDKKVEGLLYAGTEAGLYISFNGGVFWQKIQLNLPIVPINDLTIQDNDLVAATAGRSFWILDDLGAFQGSKGKFEQELMLFQPKKTYRIFGGSTDEPRPGLGQNPKSGVLIDYYLSEKKDSAFLKLKVINSDGKMIRSLSNEHTDTFESWPGGPQKPVLLTAERGVNRVVWDFTRAPLPSIDKVFVYGNYSGGHVAPGTYTLRLILDQDSVETTVEILADPRVQATLNDYVSQQDMMISIEQSIKEIHEAVNDMRSVKSQIEYYQSMLEERAVAPEIIELGGDIIAQIEVWEGALIQSDQKTFQDVINFHNQLNAQWMNLKDYVDSADPILTAGAKERFNDLEGQWTLFQQTKNQIINKEMEQFNQLYKALDLPMIMIPNR